MSTDLKDSLDHSNETDTKSNKIQFELNSCLENLDRGLFIRSYEDIKESGELFSDYIFLGH